jgi:UDP-N-acetylglucosamine--N-acetylmuramyl-(pentapeptide) pyrophosphoryl-undecaprenol N-acetylglucosamine transferase
VNIILTGGGTGGHLSIVKSLKEEIIKTGDNIIYIGSTRGQDKSWFENDNDFTKTYFLDVQGVVNQNMFIKLISIYKIVINTLKAIVIIKKHNIQKIVSVGGFSAAPASFASILLKIELYIHEQNSIMGRLNSILSKFCKKIFNSYDIGQKTDYPLNKAIFTNKRIRDKTKTIIFLGGSQGAKSINDFAISIAKQLIEQKIKIIHQCGTKDIDRVSLAYKKLDIEVDVFGFCDNLTCKIKEADLAISRSGAGTLWELVANGLPSIFVPYPYSAGNHQFYNAKFLQDKKLCFIVKESELTFDNIIKIIKKNKTDISAKLIDEISPDGAKKIVEEILQNRP